MAKKREPHKFSFYDLLSAFLGSLLIGLTFVFKGKLVRYAMAMQPINLILIMLVTVIIITFEIYALSYKHVIHKEERPFYKFWSKRFFTILFVSIITSLGLVYVYGLNQNLNSYEIFQLTIALFMPCAIAGAGAELIRK